MTNAEANDAEARLSAGAGGASIAIPLHHAFLTGDASFEAPCSLDAGFGATAGLEVGAFSYAHSWISPNVERIGRYCSIAGGVEFGATEHPVTWLSSSSFTYERFFMHDLMAERSEQSTFQDTPLPGERKRERITIGNDVWVGSGAYLRSGTKLGDGCIVGARAVVTRDVEPYAVIAGNPARIIRYRFAPELIARLRALEWWRYAFTDFQGVEATDVEAAIARLQALIDAGLAPYNPALVTLRGDGRSIWAT